MLAPLSGALSPLPRRPAGSSLRRDLISYWKLDESSAGAGAVSRADSFGSNPLTDVNTTPSASGKLNNAASFDSANSEQLTATSNASLQTGLIDFSISVWVNFASFATTNPIVGKLTGIAGTGAMEYSLSCPASGTIRFRTGNGTVFTTLDVSMTTSASTWYHLLAWVDATAGTMNLKVNNGTTSSIAVSAIQTSGALFRIGGASNSLMNGLVDEVGFWKRVLTAAEITQLYNGGSGYAFL